MVTLSPYKRLFLEMHLHMKAYWKRPATWFRWHRWLGYIVVLQFLAWIFGGLFFALVPFQTWVKGKDLVQKPNDEVIVQWEQLAPALHTLNQSNGKLVAFQSIVTAQGPALRLQYQAANGNKTVLTDMRGQVLQAPNQNHIEALAKRIYRGEGQLHSVNRFEKLPNRLGIVKELAGRENLWQAQFNDALDTRLFFDATTGEFITQRTNTWVWYDFFWRLHIMDYGDGEDFNNTLLRLASIFAVLMMVTGVVLSIRNLLRKRL